MSEISEAIAILKRITKRIESVETYTVAEMKDMRIERRVVPDNEVRFYAVCPRCNQYTLIDKSKNAKVFTRWLSEMNKRDNLLIECSACHQVYTIDLPLVRKKIFQYITSPGNPDGL